MYGYILSLTILMVVQNVNNERVREVVHRANDCLSDNLVLRCQHHIPLKIPRGIVEVYIEDLLITDEEFKGVRHVLRDSTWRSVKTLDITINDNVHIAIHNLTFTHLRKLKSLGLHSSHLTTIHQKAFVGMYKLETLDFSGCSHLNLEEIITAINKSVLPNLRALNLKELCSSKGRFLYLTKEFNNIVNSYPIEWICLTGTNVFITVQNLTWPFRYFDISNITFFSPDSSLNIAKAFPYIDHLNISRMPLRLIGRSSKNMFDNETLTPEFCTEWNNSKTKLKVLDASYIGNQYEQSFNNCILDLTSCLMFSKIETLVLKGSNIKNINSRIILPKGVRLKSLDISFNKIEYVSRNVIVQQLRFLKYLFLQYNVFHQMENNPEFGYLLNKFTKLQELNIAENKLSHIPYSMFVKNSRLRVLDLHGNHLKSITFNITHLHKLERLDLSGNKIKNIDNAVLTGVSLLELSTERNLIINFDRNPFICNCETVEFVSWLYTSKQVRPVQGLYCTLDNDIVAINAEVIQLSQYICYRDIILTIIYSVSSFVVICIIITITCVILKVRRKQHLDGLLHFIDIFKNNKLDKRYLAFLSYHNDDEEIVKQNIFQKLNETLKLRFGLEDRDVISVGDRHFQPGKSIFTEIMRCITESCIVIFVVSQSFCSSDWCRMEVKEACTQAKPIILVFREQVDIKLMPAYLRIIFERQVRVKLEHRDGEYSLVPNLQTVCASIIQLAYEDYKLKLDERQEITEHDN